MKTNQTYQLLLGLLLAGILGLLLAQKQPASPPVVVNNGRSPIAITLLQMNDVYEMSPVNNGQEGGLARVATLRQQLLQENPHTYTILSGDLFSPSAVGTAQIDTERLDGRQMVAAMNALGLDYATFGNHEFDLKQPSFMARLGESQFTWVASNVTDSNGNPFTNVPRHVIFTVSDEDGTEVRVGLFGLTLNSNPQSYVAYTDWLSTARAEVAELRPQVDILIAVTHLPVDEDRQLARSLPDIDLILGGHEHEHMAVIGTEGTPPIYKADANARTVYVHRLTFDTASHTLSTASELVAITPDLADEPNTAAVIQTWTQRAYDGFAKLGFTATEIVTTLTEPLDGSLEAVRLGSNRLTDLIAEGMATAVPNADLAIFNAGSIRIDDTLQPGPITQYDVIRVLPFGGSIIGVQISGSLLEQVLDAGPQNLGAGGYLQTAHVSGSSGAWLINNQPLDPNKSYVAAFNDFLLTGKEHNLSFLTLDAVTTIGDFGDIRFAFINQLQQTYGKP